MNILVAGGAGFIGSHLCERLLDEGHAVWAVDNFSTGEEINLDTLKQNPDFTFAACGVETGTFIAFCTDAGVRFDQVFDLACPTGVPNIEILGEEMMDTCSQGTKNVLTVALEHNAKVVFVSSSEIYGDPLVSPQSESYTGNVDPIGWRANYEEGKRFSETWVKLFATKYKLEARIVRLFNVYGPHMSTADFRVVPQFITQALGNQPITVHGEGSQERTMCFVDDLIDGLQLVMEKGERGEAYNLGSDRSITMLALAKKIVALSGSESQIIFTPRFAHDHQSRMPALDKVHSLGWEQKISLDDGLARTIDHFRMRLRSVPLITEQVAQAEMAT